MIRVPSDTATPGAVTLLACALLAWTGPALAQGIIVDNTDAGFTVLSEEWTVGTSAPGHYGASYRFRLTTDTGAAFGAVEWRPNLPASGTYQVAIYYPQGGNRADNAPFSVHHAQGDTTFYVDQQHDGGQWNILGEFPFNAGTAGSVSLSNEANPSVVIADAVSFTLTSATVQLNMAVRPAGWGTTAPAAGGSYSYDLNEVVSIAATAAPGLAFHHWEVSAGAAPLDPVGAVTTVVADQNKTVTAVFSEPGLDPPEWRGFWADAFHIGFKSIAEIDTMIAWALAGNYNAIVPEILAFHDTGGSGHGAYWTSAYVPRASDISGSIDPLAELITRAHAVGLEVHPWLVAFRVSASWPPASNPTVGAHPEWLMVRWEDANLGARPLRDDSSTTTDYYVLDPGCPAVHNYMMNIVREICENYDVDGLHWDYIRYTQQNAGYPTDLDSLGSTYRRYCTVYDIDPNSAWPPPTGDEQWDDWRRRTITEFVRRAMIEVATSDNPLQPLRHTAALVTWYPASADFTQTRPYYECYCDWKLWVELGYLDAVIPMTYFREYQYPDQYRLWSDYTIQWAHDAGRHAFIGPGIYLNTFEDTLAQIEYSQAGGADGICTYSYNSTNSGGQTWSNWYGIAAGNCFAQPAAPPPMPWRVPGSADEGVVYGRVQDGTSGFPIDDATVSPAGYAAVQTDGNGFYVLTHLPADPGGTQTGITASKSALPPPVTRPHVLVEPAGFTEANFGLRSWLPGDCDADADVDGDDWLALEPCLTGCDGGPPPAGGDIFDVDADIDVDLHDLATFQEAFTGLPSLVR